MKFPGSLTGPQIADGDLVSFTFDDAELTLRLPVVIYGSDTIDRVCSTHDFRKAETWRWDDCVGYRIKELVVQKWTYEDTVSHDDIANCRMDINILSHRDTDDLGFYLLNSDQFYHYMLKLLTDEHRDGPAEIRANWPSEANDFFLQSIAKPVVNGLIFQTDIGGGSKYPAPTAFFPLGRAMSLRIAFDFGSLHYSNRKNPYSDELLHQMKLEVFDEMLSFVQIDYTPETIKLVDAMKAKSAR